MTRRTKPRRIVAAAAALYAAAMLVAGCGSSQASRPPSKPPPIRPIMLISGADLGLLNLHYPKIVDQIYRSANAYVIGDANGHQDQVLPGSRAHPTLAYTSYSQFRRDALADRIDPIVDTVMYDPEDWTQTPAAERHDPHRYIRLFIRLAHQAGFKVIIAPGRDLALAGPGCHKREGETLDAAFLRCRYAADAVGADMILLNTSADELTVGGLERYLEKAEAQIRRSQPRVKLLGLVSTQPPSHTHAWPGGLVRATRIQLGTLAGLALNLNPKTATLAADYLRDAQQAGLLIRKPRPAAG
jgi:hypothetical protein